MQKPINMKNYRFKGLNLADTYVDTLPCHTINRRDKHRLYKPAFYGHPVNSGCRKGSTKLKVKLSISPFKLRKYQILYDNSYNELTILAYNNTVAYNSACPCSDINHSGG